MRRTAVVAAAILALALTGCADQSAPDGGGAAVSDACRDSLAALEAVDAAGLDAENAAVAASTEACTTVDEYLRGVEENPQSWWYASAERVREDADLIVASACSIDDTTAMCRDAAAQGLLG